MSVPDFWEANSESDEENPKISFEQMKKQLREYYDPSIIHTYSSALDILASFIKCQAFIYNEAGNFCRFRLNMLMFPCIFCRRFVVYFRIHHIQSFMYQE